MKRLKDSPGFEQFDALFVVFGAERDGDQRLRFAAGEQRRTVGARQNARFAPDVADFVERAAIGTAARIEHFVAEDVFLQRARRSCRLPTFCSSGASATALSCSASILRVAFELAVFLGVQRVGQIGADLLFDGGVEFCIELRRA